MKFLTSSTTTTLILSIISPIHQQKWNGATAEATSNLLQPSTSLTPEEENLLTDILSNGLSSNALSSLNEPLKKMTDRVEMELSSVQHLQKEIYNQVQTVRDLTSAFDRLRQRTNDLSDSSSGKGLIHTYNVQQLDGLIQRWQQVLKQRKEEEEESLKNSSTSITDTTNTTHDENEEEYIPLDEIKNQLTWDNIVSPSDKIVEEYVLELFIDEWSKALEKEEEKYQQELLKNDKHFQDIAGSEVEKAEKIDGCVNIVQAANVIQSSIWESQDQKDNYLTDATIVYGPRWTSDTASIYNAQEKESFPVSLGEYREYIPQDWERLLPDGWEEWDVSYVQEVLKHPLRMVPNYLWESLPSTLVSIIPNLEKTARPEVILNSNLSQRSCWPMAGSSGQVTFRLTHPVVVEGFTIDHLPSFSKHLSRDDSSTPQSITLIGYPSCDEEMDSDDVEDDCLLYGFDTSRPIDLGSFEYQLVSLPKKNGKKPTGTIGLSRQTFDITSSSNPLLGLDDDDETDEVPQGSCTSMTSCGSPLLFDDVDADDQQLGSSLDDDDDDDKKIVALKMVIDDNYGNPDFTCLYNVQLHGKKV